MYKIIIKIRWGLYKILVMPIIKASFNNCGKDVVVGERFSVSGIENITVGNHCSISDQATFLCTRAPIVIGNHVMFGPRVTIVTGNHRTDLIGKYMDEVTDNDKRPEDDIQVVIEDDVWIGSNVTILKGVTIHTGSVISAGSVVVNDVEPYSIVGGIPAREIKKRFCKEEIEEHKRRMRDNR